jgi:DNA adenine methylase
MRRPLSTIEAEPRPLLPAAPRLLPPLKWAGGKRWQIRHLVGHWREESHRRLVEPFCGGLAVTLGLRPERALLNDINPHVINFYRWVKAGLVLSLPMEKDETLYYAHRKRFNELLASGGGETREAASLFYYLNRTGYNGLCRFNGSGEFNVPFGQYNRINYRSHLLDYQPLFAGWELTATHFADVPLDDEDFVYADPPYDVEFTQYSQGGFDWDEQEATARWLSTHKGPVILSNQATPRIRKLYRSLGFKLRSFDAPRRISCNGDRTPAQEVLAFRNLRVV